MSNIKKLELKISSTTTITPPPFQHKEGPAVPTHIRYYKPATHYPHIRTVNAQTRSLLATAVDLKHTEERNTATKLTINIRQNIHTKFIFYCIIGRQETWCKAALSSIPPFTWSPIHRRLTNSDKPTPIRAVHLPQMLTIEPGYLETASLLPPYPDLHILHTYTRHPLSFSHTTEAINTKLDLHTFITTLNVQGTSILHPDNTSIMYTIK